MTFRKFLALSVVLHILAITGIYFIPAATKEEVKEFMTSLVSPEEPPVPEPEKAPEPQVPIPPRVLPPVTKVRPAAPPPSARPEELLPKGGSGTGSETQEPGPSREKEAGIPSVTEKAARSREGTGEKTPGPAGPSLEPDIFDSGVITDIARRGTGKGDAGPPGKTKDSSVTFDTRDYQFAPYMKKLKDKIESIWIYPTDASRKGIYGDLKIRFTILKNGRLGAVELLRTSGYKSLDDAAIKALRDGEPYWPLPDDWEMNSYTITGHFIYSMRGYFVR